MKVIWTAKARITYFKVLDYLEKNWSKREIMQFSRTLAKSAFQCIQLFEKANSLNQIPNKKKFIWNLFLK